MQSGDRVNLTHSLGTFIMPTGAAKPSILRQPRLRWKLEVCRLKARFENLRGYLDPLVPKTEISTAYSDTVSRIIMYKFFVAGRPYPKIARRKALATAIALHKRMYTALAEYVCKDPSPAECPPDLVPIETTSPRCPRYVPKACWLRSRRAWPRIRMV
jgi:hypothetical protein